jgi:hypothetical protein
MGLSSDCEFELGFAVFSKQKTWQSTACSNYSGASDA